MRISDWSSDVCSSDLTVALEDGSRVTLDTDTILHIAYSPTERGLKLERGRARFDVSYDASRPFVVFAGGGSITAHGTVFDVAVVDRHVSVALLRRRTPRSEEHTSELQSLMRTSYAVFCLKKNKRQLEARLQL